MIDKLFPVTTYKVTEEYEGVRLDNCLISRIKGLPRTKIYSIIRKGEVRVNGSRSKPSRRLTEGDKIRIPPYSVNKKSTKKIQKQSKEILNKRVVFEDDSLIVIDKPVGIASHGGSGISLGLIESVRQIKLKFKNAQLVHRLDKETSGCILIALKRPILRKLHKELREGRVEKEYLTIVKGQWPSDLTKIDLKLRKKQLRSGQREVKIEEEGKRSISHFELIKKTKELSLLKCRILTGRTHQIRVHVNYVGHPILGDLKYGDKKFNEKMKEKGLNRMLLHSHSIKFPELGLDFKVNKPRIFQELLK